MIDFESDESHLLLNPRMPAEERERLIVPALPGHVFVTTSGSTGSVKLVALSKAAILASAAAVNGYFGVTRDDVFAAVLPPFHVGGLGIYARAHLSGARVIAMEWEPRAFAESDATIASLVPAQVHDLVELGLRARPAMRAILVGGAAFDPELATRARALGWPVHASYGMSECASTVAIGPPLELLPHLEARIDADDRLALHGASLFTGYVEGGVLTDPKVDGWFVSEDRAALDGRILTITGRPSDFVKIGGESVDLRRLDRILALITPDAALFAAPDERLGHVIHLAVTRDDPRAVDEFNARVLPFERARAVHRIDEIPRSPLGKLLRRELEKRIR
ncbi:MAG TPA: AMP-binding protein [Thermoanaerobaculia bacterium]|jgi:O-succinylbenzoic acid--CoA ligase|nr:AMP-binding protein [Thermoanaerobaculia bacterium]